MKLKSGFIGIISGFLVIISGIIMLFYRPTDWVGPINILSEPGETLKLQIVFPPYYFLGYLFVTIGALVSVCFTILIPEENNQSNKRALKVLN